MAAVNILDVDHDGVEGVFARRENDVPAEHRAVFGQGEPSFCLLHVDSGGVTWKRKALLGVDIVVNDDEGARRRTAWVPVDCRHTAACGTLWFKSAGETNRPKLLHLVACWTRTWNMDVDACERLRGLGKKKAAHRSIFEIVTLLNR